MSSLPDNTLLKMTDCPINDPRETYAWGPAIHETYAMHYILSGRGYYITNDDIYTVTAGESFLVFPNELVHYYPDPEDPWTYTWVNFVGQDAIALLAMTNFNQRPVCPQILGLQEIFDKFKPNIKLEYLKQRNSGLLRELLSHYIEHYPVHNENLKALDYVSAAKEYIASRFHLHNFNVSLLASDIGLERSYLYRIFMEKEGIPPSEYLANLRMEKAVQHIKNGVSNVSVIAYSVGYSDPLYFSKVFKRKYGVTPTNYIKQIHS